jgi:hypothetical protein
VAIDALTEEIVDRFGPLPPPATNLLRVARLKLQARAIGIRRLDLGSQGGYALFEEANQVDPKSVIRWCSTPIGTTASKARSSCASRTRPTSPSASSSPRNSWASCAGTPAGICVRSRAVRPEDPLELPGILSPHEDACRRDVALSRCAGLAATALAQTTPATTVYTIEVIVFRNLSGAGGPEDWGAKPVARGPETPDSPSPGDS